MTGSSRQKESQQAARNEELASLAQLVAGVAHEINNPLAFVVNNVFLVQSALDSLAPEAEQHLSQTSLGKLRKARSRLAEMTQGLDRVKELVCDLRTISRPDEDEFTNIDVVETIDAVLLLLDHKMQSRITIERHHTSGCALYWSAGRLHQVLMNLLANAADAIDGKGRIVITTIHSPELLLISVRDTGAGIPDELRGRIFEPFFSTKPAGQGVGLGLAISLGIVQKHGGSIEVQSKVGVGTEFIVKIPLA